MPFRTYTRSTRALVALVVAGALVTACEVHTPTGGAGAGVGPLASITVMPARDTLAVLTSAPFVAVGRDASNNVVAITPVWTVTNGGGTVSSTGSFTAGNAAGLFTGTIRATSGTIFGTASVLVTAAAVTPPVIPIGAASPYGILAGTQVTCITGGRIEADIGVSPGNTLTGFGPCVFTGVANLGNANAATAQNALTTAYNTIAGMTCPPANAIVANLGGTTLAAGVYCTATGISVTGTLTLNGGGDPNAVFVFQAGSSLTTAGNVVLINGAQARNVFWQVGSSATLGTGSQWQGNILALSSITLDTGANLFGRALARNGAVSLDANNTITLP